VDGGVDGGVDGYDGSPGTAPAGPYVWAGALGERSGRTGEPVDVAVDPGGGTVYVASRRAGRVTRWTPGGRYLGGFAAAPAGEPDLVPAPPAAAAVTPAAWPAGVACDSAGAVYVSDEGRRRVCQYAPDGELLATWGVWGWPGLMRAVRGRFGRVVPGRFARPAGVAAGPDGRVYVVEAFHRRVEQYAPGGDLLAAWDGGGAPGGAFGLPWGVAVDPARGDVYVTDWARDRVLRFDPAGHVVGTLGRPGSAPGSLRRPAGVAVDPQGRLAVADWGNDRVQVFAPDGRPEAVLRGPAGAAAAARLRGPRGVAFDGRGTLYVADTLGRRVQVFRRRER